MRRYLVMEGQTRYEKIDVDDEGSCLEAHLPEDKPLFHLVERTGLLSQHRKDKNEPLPRVRYAIRCPGSLSERERSDRLFESHVKFDDAVIAAKARKLSEKKREEVEIRRKAYDDLGGWALIPLLGLFLR